MLTKHDDDDIITITYLAIRLQICFVPLHEKVRTVHQYDRLVSLQRAQLFPTTESNAVTVFRKGRNLATIPLS